MIGLGVTARTANRHPTNGGQRHGGPSDRVGLGKRRVQPAPITTRKSSVRILASRFRAGRAYIQSIIGMLNTGTLP